tara:strand:+ start:1263 stop:1568 length:306 start_codon:yes stop_codon:yes gene_type:complete
MSLTYIDHLALESSNIEKSVSWYREQFNCEVTYQDSSWALIRFDNISLALVSPGEHPPHFAIVDKNVRYLKDHKVHRDGIAYRYEPDPDLNVIEKIDRRSS